MGARNWAKAVQKREELLSWCRPKLPEARATRNRLIAEGMAAAKASRERTRLLKPKKGSI
jgi:hypothetical protein